MLTARMNKQYDMPWLLGGVASCKGSDQLAVISGMQESATDQTDQSYLIRSHFKSWGLINACALSPIHKPRVEYQVLGIMLD